jgi:hypothetical protein
VISIVENALCPVADEPKLLDFPPIEAHGFSHHRLRTDQAAGGTGSRSACKECRHDPHSPRARALRARAGSGVG